VHISIPVSDERADFPSYIKITAALSFSLAVFQEKNKIDIVTKPWTGFDKSK